MVLILLFLNLFLVIAALYIILKREEKSKRELKRTLDKFNLSEEEKKRIKSIEKKVKLLLKEKDKGKKSNDDKK